MQKIFVVAFSFSVQRLLLAGLLLFHFATHAANVDLVVSGKVTQVQNVGGTTTAPASIGDPIQVKISYDPATPPYQTSNGFYGGTQQWYSFGSSLASVVFSTGSSTVTYSDGIAAQTAFSYPGGGCQGFLTYGLFGWLTFTPFIGGSFNLGFLVFSTPPLSSDPPLLRSANLPASLADFGLLPPPISGPYIGGCPSAQAAYNASVTTNGWTISANIDPASILIGPSSQTSIPLTQQNLPNLLPPSPSTDAPSGRLSPPITQ